MTRWLPCLVVVLGRLSYGAELELTVPPSVRWVEVEDTQRLPAAKATSRVFTDKGDPAVTLRVVTNPSRKLDYLPAVVAEMAERLRGEARREGHQVRVLEATTVEVEGVRVARILSVEVANVEAPTKTLSYHLPGEDGDVTVSLFGAQWEPAVEAEVTQMVMQARGVRASAQRGRDSIDSGQVLLGVVVLTFLLTVVGLVVGLRGKKAP